MSSRVNGHHWRLFERPDCAINYSLMYEQYRINYFAHYVSFQGEHNILSALKQIGFNHYSDVIMGPKGSQITSLTIAYSTVYSGVDQRKHQSSVSLAFVRGIHRSPVNSPHKWPVMRKMIPFDDVIMIKKIWTVFILLHICCISLLCQSYDYSLL